MPKPAVRTNISRRRREDRTAKNTECGVYFRLAIELKVAAERSLQAIAL